MAKESEAGSCEFCSAEAREGAFAEQGEFLALYNISPIVPGHSLVIPKRHETCLTGLSRDELGDFFSFGREVTDFIVRTYGAEGYDWTVQQSEIAGQSVPHLHLHVIPRKPNDLDKDWHDELEESHKDGQRRRLTQDQMVDIARRLRAEAAEVGLWEGPDTSI